MARNAVWAHNLTCGHMQDVIPFYGLMLRRFLKRRWYINCDHIQTEQCSYCANGVLLRHLTLSQRCSQMQVSVETVYRFTGRHSQNTCIIIKDVIIVHSVLRHLGSDGINACFQIGDVHGLQSSYCGLLYCDVMQSSKWVQTFWRNILPVMRRRQWYVSLKQYGWYSDQVMGQTLGSKRLYFLSHKSCAIVADSTVITDQPVICQKSQMTQILSIRQKQQISMPACDGKM